MNAWHITRKDLLVLWRDRRSLVVLLILPLVFITIIGLSTGRLLGWQNQNDALKVAIVNLDQGELSQSIVQRLGRHEGLAAQSAVDIRAAERLLEAGRCVAVVRFGPEFEQRVGDLRSVDALQIDQGPLARDLSALDVHITSEPTLTNVEAIVRMIVQGEVLRGVIPAVLRKNGWIRNYIRVHARAADEPAESPPAVPAAPQRLGYGSIVYQTIVPSYTVLFTFFLVTIMAGSFVAERDAGTLRRLQTLPVDSAALVVGKTLPFLCISLCQGALLFLAGKVLFGMDWGRHPALLATVIVCTSLSATCLGLLVATLVRTTSQVSTFATLIIIVMAGISGCFMPRAWLPPAMQQVSLATPHAWALMAYNQLLNSAAPDLYRVGRCCLMLIGFSTLYALLGWWRFRQTK
ncbi:MAG: ABC transporter permease [Planctomycetaceae bacterium]